MAKILVIDDDRLETTLIQFTFKEMGHQVITAVNGREGLGSLKINAPDAVILDIQMPEMSGYEFMSELKALGLQNPPPVIMLTANDNMQDIFYSEGVAGYFVKPVDPRKLEAKIKECLLSR